MNEALVFGVQLSHADGRRRGPLTEASFAHC